MATSPTSTRSGRPCRTPGSRRPTALISLDDNRQAISNNYVKRVVPDADGDGVPEVETIRRIPDVDQSVWRHVHAGQPGARPLQPAVRAARRSVGGKAEEVDQRGRPASTEGVTEAPNAGNGRPRAPSRSSACGGSAGASAASTPCGSSTWRCVQRSVARSWARTGPEDDALQPDLRRVPAHLGDGRAVRLGRHRRACPEAGEDGPLPHLPDGAAVPRPHGRGQRLPRGPRRTRGAPPAGALAEGRRDARARPRGRHRDGPGRGARPHRRPALPWRAAPARGGDGAGHQPEADDARRARRGLSGESAKGSPSCWWGSTRRSP